MEKSRLAPIKTFTMPRFEVNAAAIGVKLYNKIIDEIDLQIENVKFWSESTLKLQYIASQSYRFKSYVANRVTQILQRTSAGEWIYVEARTKIKIKSK